MQEPKQDYDGEPGVEHVNGNECEKSTDPNEKVYPEHFLNMRHLIRHLKQISMTRLLDRIATQVRRMVV